MSIAFVSRALSARKGLTRAFVAALRYLVWGWGMVMTVTMERVTSCDCRDTHVSCDCAKPFHEQVDTKRDRQFELWLCDQLNS